MLSPELPGRSAKAITGPAWQLHLSVSLILFLPLPSIDFCPRHPPKSYTFNLVSKSTSRRSLPTTGMKDKGDGHGISLCLAFPVPTEEHSGLSHSFSSFFTLRVPPLPSTHTKQQRLGRKKDERTWGPVWLSAR